LLVLAGHRLPPSLSHLALPLCSKQAQTIGNLTAELYPAFLLTVLSFSQTAWWFLLLHHGSSTSSILPSEPYENTLVFQDGAFLKSLRAISTQITLFDGDGGDIKSTAANDHRLRSLECELMDPS